MKMSIQKERDAMEKLWKSREKQLEKVLLNAAHVRGSIEGIAGSDNIDMPLLDMGPKGKAIAAASRFAYGPLLKQLRTQSIKRRYDHEPEWRRPGEELV